MRLPVFLLAALSLASCSSLSAYEARTKLLNMNEADLLACAGVPDAFKQTGAHEGIVTYRYTDTTPILSLTVVTGGSLSVGAKGTCEAVFEINHGLVDHIAYPDHTSNIEGDLAACAPLIEECLSHRASNPLDPGYDYMKLFGDATK